MTASGMLHQFSNMVTSGEVNNNKKFLGPAYRSMAACCANPYSMPTVIEVAPGMLPQTYALLEMHKNDAETVARILEFLRYFAEDANGCGLIMQRKKEKEEERGEQETGSPREALREQGSRTSLLFVSSSASLVCSFLF